MLKTFYLYLLFLLSVCLVTAIPGYGWAYEQQTVIEGVLKRAERTIIKDPNGKKETKVERSIVLVTDKPLVLSRSVTIANQQITSTETSYPHIEVHLPEEFISLIGKRVQCTGYFKRSPDLFADEIVLDVDTALDCEQLMHHPKTVFYEPEEVELSGMLCEAVYPGPPEYMSVEMGDCPEEVVILTLKNPIDVEIRKGDYFNEPEKGVRELQVVFSDSMPSIHQMKEEIALKGTLYHGHTAHHRRRVLMRVKSWRVK
jgi:hypothetical protein